jgi:RNA 2',3'-cyclic 3'-phosphodiesterase
VRTALGAFGRAAAGADVALRAVGDESLHVTLVFLGHRALDEIDVAAGVVEEAASGVAAPLLEVAGPRWLSPRRPHVLTVELVDRGGALRALQAALAAAFVEELGLVPERRRFLPHVTVARVRRGAVPRREGLPDLAAIGPFGGEAVTLYRSWLGRGPARYEPLLRVELVTAP